jgi:hypothetical protein
MRGSSRRRPVGREDGEYIVARCPRDVLVSTPRSLWEEDRANVESVAFTLGRRITPAETRDRTRRLAKLPGRVAREAALDERDRAIVRESEAERTYEAIGQEQWDLRPARATDRGSRTETRGPISLREPVECPVGVVVDKAF